MCAAAEFHAEPGHADHPNGVSVLLAEKGHCSGGDGFLGRPQLGYDRRVARDLLVDDALDAFELLSRDRLEMDEVEAEPIRRHERSGLFHMRAQHLSQRGVQQMRGGVVAARGITGVGVDFRRDDIAHTQGARRHAHAVSPRQPGAHPHQTFDRGVGALVENSSRIGHLTAGLEIERRFLQGDVAALPRLE